MPRAHVCHCANLSTGTRELLPVEAARSVIDCLDVLLYVWCVGTARNVHTLTILSMRTNGKSSLQLSDTDNTIIAKTDLHIFLSRLSGYFSCVKTLSTTCHFRLLATLNQVKREMHHKIALNSKRKIRGDTSGARFLCFERRRGERCRSGLLNLPHTLQSNQVNQ